MIKAQIWEITVIFMLFFKLVNEGILQLEDKTGWKSFKIFLQQCKEEHKIKTTSWAQKALYSEPKSWEWRLCHLSAIQQLALPAGSVNTTSHSALGE